MGVKWLTKYLFCHSGVIDTAVTKIGDFIVDLLREFISHIQQIAYGTNLA
jgi:hypothetical protein